jgi:hypothetical protein
LIGEILVTAIIGGAIAGWAARSPDPGIVLLAVGTWVYIAIAWTFGSWLIAAIVPFRAGYGGCL